MFYTFNVSDRTNSYEEEFEKKLQQAEKSGLSWFEEIKEIILLAGVFAIFVLILPVILGCLVRQHKKMKTVMKTYELANQSDDCSE